MSLALSILPGKLKTKLALHSNFAPLNKSEICLFPSSPRNHSALSAYKEFKCHAGPTGQNFPTTNGHWLENNC